MKPEILKVTGDEVTAKIRKNLPAYARTYVRIIFY